MKFHFGLLLFVAAFLAVSSKEINTEEVDYELKPAAAEDQQDSETPYEDYQLMEGKGPSELAEEGSSEAPGIEPYKRICLVVRCVPRWSKWKICWCVRWGKR